MFRQVRAGLLALFIILGLGACSSHVSTIPPKDDEKLALREVSMATMSPQSKFVNVLGSDIHYLESGSGDPILFIHGQPTSSYLWRNVLPFVQDQGRVIAIDLIGMGRSEKPKIEYSYADHARYLSAFIDSLGLKNLTLVGHDWGTVLGLDYAMRHESRVKGVAYMEALIPPAFPLPNLNALPKGPREAFAGFRDPVLGRQLLIEQNMFIEEMLPSMVKRKLSEREMNAYRRPFLDPQSREPLYKWPNQLPIAGKPAVMDRLIRQVGDWLKNSPIPKLHIYASPGAINPPEFVASTTTLFKNVETAFVGDGLHFIQEDQPEAIGRALSDWLRRLDQEHYKLESTALKQSSKLKEPTMKSFLIFHSSINDPDNFMNYAKAVGPTLAPFDGQVLLKGKVQNVFSGVHELENVGILGFPDYESAKGWYESDAYQALIENRDAAATMTIIGYQSPTP